MKSSAGYGRCGGRAYREGRRDVMEAVSMHK